MTESAAPETLAGLLCYPRQIAELFLGQTGLPAVDDLEASGAVAVQRWLGPGVRVYSCYSGIGMPELACSAYQKALRCVAEERGLDLGEWQGFHFMEAFELKPHARAVLVDHVTPAEHVFGRVHCATAMTAEVRLNNRNAARLRLANPSGTDAEWQLVHLLDEKPAMASTMDPGTLAGFAIAGEGPRRRKGTRLAARAPLRMDRFRVT